MTQAAIGTIDPNATSGTDLAALLTAFGGAFESGNSGASRPSYIAAGGTWLDTSTTVWKFKLYLGSGTDIILLSIDTVAFTVTFSGTVGSSPSLPSYVAPSRKVATANSLMGGGDLSADRTLQLVNDLAAASIPSNYYYGTGTTAGVLGWNPVSGAGRPGVLYNAFGAGTYSFTVPAGVTNINIMIYGGGGGGDGSGGIGGRAMGSISVTPGGSYTLVVGAQGGGGTGGSSSFGSAVTVTGGTAGYGGSNTGNGTAYIGGGVNMVGIAPTLADSNGTQPGAPNVDGFAIITWIANT